MNILHNVDLSTYYAIIVCLDGRVVIFTLYHIKITFEKKSPNNKKIKKYSVDLEYFFT